MTKSIEILQKYWGYSSFRPLQEEIVDSAIYGHDTLAILPTGGGKSICYQVPGLALDGLTIVISPLIALMEDQVQNLKKRGIRAELITSALSFREIDTILDNARFSKMRFLYTSPERLQSPLFIERCKNMKVALIAVDEAHCISEWGHEFRPAYREIASLREMHPEAPVMALTASATPKVQEDIISHLQLRHPERFSSSLLRENLHYQARVSQNKTEDVVAFCRRHVDHCGIVYCQTRRSVKMMARQLRAAGISAGFYHGGLSAEDRSFMLDAWMKDQLRVMVATNAFGMGIDKPDVRYVLHLEMPNNLEAYYQEAGRGGRDGKEALAVAFWEAKDLEKMRTQLVIQYPEKERVKEIFQAVCSFLKIAYAGGEQETYDFDIQLFHSHYSYSIQEVYYGLKLLQMNGTLEFTENAFHPTRVRFAIGQSALYKFQVAHDSLSPAIALLTRTTPGIFEQFCRIDERELAKRLSVSQKDFRNQLEHLERYGVIDAHYQSSLPKIVLLVPRPTEANMQISAQIYDQRQQLEEGKLNAVADYLQADLCRQQFICRYFESDSEECGKCDICLSKQRSTYTFKELVQLIPERLPASQNELLHSLGVEKELLQRALHQLMLDEKIYFDRDLYRKA